MIKVNLYYNNMDNLWKFDVSGHAGYANHGQDIVCAGVSMIVINTINSIETFTNGQIVIENDEDLGLIKCLCLNVKNNEEPKDVILLLNSMVLGLESIQNEYKEHIKINIHLGG